LIVGNDDLDLFAKDASLGVDLIEGKMHAFVGGDAEGGGAAGEGAVFADDDVLGAGLG